MVLVCFVSPFQYAEQLGVQQLEKIVDCSKSGLGVLTSFKLCEKWRRAAKQPDAAHILQWDHVTPLGSTATIS